MNYTTTKEDKFNKTKSIVWNFWDLKPNKWAIASAAADLGIIWIPKGAIPIGGANEGLGMGMTKTETEKGVSVFTIDYEYHNWEWMHLGNGSIQILLDDGTTLKLEGHETRTHVYSQDKKGGKIFEKGYWIISEEDLKKVCASSNTSIRVSGSNFHIEFDEEQNEKFLFMVRTMYSETIDSSSYKKEIGDFQKKLDEKKASDNRKAIIFIVIFVILMIMGYIVGS